MPIVLHFRREGCNVPRRDGVQGISSPAPSVNRTSLIDLIERNILLPTQEGKGQGER